MKSDDFYKIFAGVQRGSVAVLMEQFFQRFRLRQIFNRLGKNLR